MEDIAVVGIANLFPGSDTPQTFWEQLLQKQDNRSPITALELGVEPQKYFGKKGDADKFYCMYGGYIRDFEFDPASFVCEGLNKTYLEQLDDLHKWGLYVTEQALSDAGYWGSDKLQNCGLILGNLSFPSKTSNHLFLPLYAHVVESALKQLISGDFQLSSFSATQSVNPDNALIAGFPSALLSKAAGLGGSVFSLDAACASSCYSVKLACDYLHTGKADMMLAGAVSGADPLFVNMGFSIFQAFPADNKHAPLDKNSQGLFAAEGAGMMVLKRHADALRDGDKIHAIIKGGALSNDGKGEFVLSPNSKGQVLAYQRAYQDAEVNPADVDYIECHATGTPKGDKVELSSMESFFSQYHHKPLLGSAKSNLGHLLTAAGMPGMTKAIWALNEGKIPATISLKDPMSSKNGYFGAAQMPTETVDWPSKDKIRSAGVSVFGFGGSNAHLVLQPGNTAYAPSSSVVKPREPLAIVGMDCHFGSASSLAEFDTLLTTAQTTFRELPPKRWKGMDQDPAIKQTLLLNKAPRGGYIENFDIDFLRFKVPPNEQDCLIPQQLLMMKVADNAAKDAQLSAGSNVAVLVAMGMELDLHQYRGRVNLSSQIEQSLKEQGIQLSSEQQLTLNGIAKESIASAAQLNQYTSFIGNIMASRIAALWDFSGPAFTVSSEENSVYRCLEIAENLFQTSDVEAVLIASVDLAGSLENISLRQRYGAVSENATNKPNLLDSQQWLVGEGAGAFVVKPESKTDANTVYATVDGLIFVPGSDALAIEQAAQKACQIANLSCAQVNHVEAFASGFRSDNQAEKSAFNKLYPDAKVASVKAQVGHLFNASGMASIIKTALLLDKQQAGEHRAINGLGKDFCCAHLILSASNTVRQAALKADTNDNTKNNTKAAPKKSLSLVKTITLGGADIKQAILKQSDNPVFSVIKQQIAGKVLTPVIDPVRLDSLQIKRTDVASSPALDSSFENESETVTVRAETIQAATIQTATLTGRAGVNVSSKTSKDIFQQTKTHLAFIRSRHAAEQQIAQLIKVQLQLTLSNCGSVEIDAAPVKTPSAAPLSFAAKAQSKVARPQSSASASLPIKGGSAYAYPPLQLIERYNQPQNIIYDNAALVEFAEGNIANVFGSEYAVIDSYSRRVRLPTTDYLLVTRVTDLQATVNEYQKSYMATEYDIPTDAPFLIDGQIPWSVSVESGQCDLMLISYIGIDFQNKGERVYRLLDCELTFLEEMAFGGETLRYEIYIDSYAKNGEQLLFFFHYDCFVGDKKVLIMRNGCAGFFSDAELADGKGVLHNDQDKAQFAQAKKSSFQPLIANQRSQYGYEEMLKLVDGDVSGCFGPEYDQQGRNPSLKFSSKKFLMIERITKVDPQGGHWGLGLLEGQKKLDPEHWYFPCHFKDDQVMAGSLMSEGCGQMAMFFMLWLGMNNKVNNARFQPMAGEAQTVRCRGQVLPQSNTLTYRMEVTAIGMRPRPFIKANIDIILDGKVVVDFKNLCVEMKEQDANSPYPVTLPENVRQTTAAPLIPATIRAMTRDPVSMSVDLALSRLEEHLAKTAAARVKPLGGNLLKGNLVANEPVKQSGAELGFGLGLGIDERGIDPFKHPERPLMRVESDLNAHREKGVIPIKHFAAPMAQGQNRVPDQTPFTPWHLFEFATGDISNCFGPDFDVYRGRIPPRTPCGDLQVVTQVTEVNGKRLDLKNPANCTAQYYVPEDAWYFTKNSHSNWMPYALLMEIALQPNGFLSGYMGTTLKYPQKELFFRNLDGNGTLLKQIDLRGKTIVNKSVLLSTSTAGGAIIQSFTFDLLVDDQVFYRGNAVFGYFSGESLTNQLGIDNGKITQAWFVDQKTAPERIERFDLTDKKSPLFEAPADKPYYRLAGGQMNFVDSVSIVEGGGKADLAYIYGERTIDASDWFFRYHFHQDPVMPGSLGVEAIIELLQTYALKNDLGAGFKNPRFITPETEVIWKYRGQITPLNKQMSLDVHLTKIIRNQDEVRLVGDASLSKDGLRIYQVKDIVLSIVEA
ncbi:MAG: acyl transferase domain-containing protein/3-hydroxymyristoyl [Psychromonas sp.]|jgi:acyl transferase domain-containing protein/3-hydroxymyristoyl/3-hydroxydecanoyl-(acyl carrier protein) dehydratase|uniref:hotdog fold thioesterase n=1 Tax=Psychromonas sp. TaxID=1884585 RepID=UPI0039E59013